MTKGIRIWRVSHCCYGAGLFGSGICLPAGKSGIFGANKPLFADRSWRMAYLAERQGQAAVTAVPLTATMSMPLVSPRTS